MNQSTLPKLTRCLLLSLLTFNTIVLLITPDLVNAQSNQIELSVSPPTSYIKIKPGSSATHTITLENKSNQEVLVTPEALDFASDGVSGRPVLSNQHSFPYFADESVFSRPLTMQAGQKAQLILTMQVPQGATEKEYPMTILFQGRPTQGNEISTGSQVTPTIGTNLIVLVSYSDQLSENISLKDIQIPRIVDSFQPLAFDVLVENNSVYASPASGSAAVVNWRGKTVAEFAVYPDVILGSSSRLLRSLTWKTVANSADEPVPGRFVYPSNVLFGPYKITVTLTNATSTNPGSDSNTIKETSYSEVVFAVPIFFILGLTITSGLVFGLHYYYQNKQKDKNPFIS